MRFPSCVGIPPESELPFINLLVFWILIYFWNNNINFICKYKFILFTKVVNWSNLQVELELSLKVDYYWDI